LIIYVGAVGQGKTFNAVACAAKWPGPNVFANIDLKIPNRDCFKWHEFTEIKDSTCGTLLIDECDMWLNSREFAKLDPHARDLLKEHRKHHLRLVMTTQDVSFVDKVFRKLTDEVRVVRRATIPFVGWFWPDAVRPSIRCPHCKVVRQDDGTGDHDAWWGRWFGCATLYFWKVYPPSILGEVEGNAAEELERLEVEPVGRGWRLFSQKIAAMYDTSAMASQEARKFRAARPKFGSA